jgi:hypothetical protein
MDPRKRIIRERQIEVSLYVLLHDALKSEFESQRSVTEASIAMKWLVKTRCCGNEYAYNSRGTVEGGVFYSI